MTNVPGWTQLSSQPVVLTREYSFGAGLATAVAVLLPARGWLIVSPPCTLLPGEQAAFAAGGDVFALVANNGAHHMGLTAWGAAFPKATSYAAPRAAARIRKRVKQPGQLALVDALTSTLPDEVALLAMDGDKIGDLLLRVKSERGVILYASDMIANIPRLPRNPLARLIFKLSDSAPGLKIFTLFFKFFVKDPIAARKFLIRELETNPPSILVPAHGDVITRPDIGPTLIGMLRA